ncbi:MAG: DedA family protein [Betaproteobacteria bacterium]|nr:DedA family protein [Betaproteobacteria bacterium]
MTLQQLVETYGYWVVLAGAFLEGETVLVLAGVAVRLGYLSFPWVAALAFAGAFAGDQLYFWLGRRYGDRLLARFPPAAAAMERVKPHLERHGTLFILVMRFIYGVRIAGPVGLGMSAVPGPRYLWLNAVAAVFWSVVVVAAGYLFAQAVEQVLADLRRIEELLFVAIAAAGVMVWVLRRRRARRRSAGGS